MQDSNKEANMHRVDTHYKRILQGKRTAKSKRIFKSWLKCRLPLFDASISIMKLKLPQALFSKFQKIGQP